MNFAVVTLLTSATELGPKEHSLCLLAGQYDIGLKCHIENVKSYCISIWNNRKRVLRGRCTVRAEPLCSTSCRNHRTVRIPRYRSVPRIEATVPSTQHRTGCTAHGKSGCGYELGDVPNDKEQNSHRHDPGLARARCLSISRHQQEGKVGPGRLLDATLSNPGSCWTAGQV